MYVTIWLRDSSSSGSSCDSRGTAQEVSDGGEGGIFFQYKDNGILRQRGIREMVGNSANSFVGGLAFREVELDKKRLLIKGVNIYILPFH